MLPFVAPDALQAMAKAHKEELKCQKQALLDWQNKMADSVTPSRALVARYMQLAQADLHCLVQQLVLGKLIACLGRPACSDSCSSVCI